MSEKDDAKDEREQAGAEKPDVYKRLRAAYEHNRGVRLTADEVFDLVQMNDAVHQSCFDER